MAQIRDNSNYFPKLTAGRVLVEPVMQDGSDVYFIDDLNRPLFACGFGQATNDDAVNEFIAHFAGKRGGVKIFLYIPYKVVCVLADGFRFAQFPFKFFNLRRK